MVEKRGKSNAPLILGIIGAVVSLPNLLCASACAAVVGTASGSLGAGIFIMGLLPVVLGFVFAFFGKSRPTLCGIGMLIAAVVTFIFLVMTGFGSVLSWIALILFIIAGIIAFVQEKEA